MSRQSRLRSACLVLCLCISLFGCGRCAGDVAGHPVEAPDRGATASEDAVGSEGNTDTPSHEVPLRPNPTACHTIIQDADPPAKVRREPDGNADVVMELAGGAFVEIAARRGQWSRLRAPGEGWVHNSLVVDTCSTPAFWPGVGIGTEVYALVTRNEKNVPPVPSGAEVIGQVMFEEPQPMMFYAMPLDAPLPTSVTAVSENNTCSGTPTRALRLWGVCDDPDQDGPGAGWATEYIAFELDCPNADPRMIVVAGPEDREVQLRARWAPTRGPVTAHQRSVVGTFSVESERYLFGDGTNISMIHQSDDIGTFMFIGDALIHHVKAPAEPEGAEQLKVGNWLFAVVPTGSHGYGRFIMPASRRLQPTWMWFPAATCGAY